VCANHTPNGLTSIRFTPPAAPGSNRLGPGGAAWLRPSGIRANGPAIVATGAGATSGIASAVESQQRLEIDPCRALIGFTCRRHALRLVNSRNMIATKRTAVRAGVIMCPLLAGSSPTSSRSVRRDRCCDSRREPGQHGTDSPTTAATVDRGELDAFPHLGSSRRPVTPFSSASPAGGALAAACPPRGSPIGRGRRPVHAGPIHICQRHEPDLAYADHGGSK
jgi:hypothetical protein